VLLCGQTRRDSTRIKRQEAALLLVSSAVLAYQVVLVRAFSIGQWHHLAYMVISIALLGFGASGTLLAALERRKANPATRRAQSSRLQTGWFALSATAFALTVPISFWLTQQVPFEPFLMIWDHRQLLYLGCYYLVLFVPFFAAATAIGLALTRESECCPRLYAFNLTGSGVGAFLAVVLLSVAPVEWALVGVGALALGAAVLALLDARPIANRAGRRRLAVAGIATVATLTIIYVSHPPAVRLSQYKSLSYALNLPQARMVAERSSALSRVDVVASPAIREAPGLSLVAPAEAVPPPQLGLYVDAETAGAITSFDGDTGRLSYLDWSTTAAPYFALPEASRGVQVCVLGSGAGASVLLALLHGAQQVDAVELDPNVLDLLQGRFRAFTGALYSRPEVRVHRAEARAFVQAARGTWDIIDLSLLDSLAASAVGVGAVAENYLYTREAFEAFLHHLRPGGLLAVTRWARMPPRDELKLFATAIAALERMGLNPSDRLTMIRSWATVTLLVKREPFQATELAALRRWAEQRLFDTCYSAGIAADHPNRFNVLERDYYAEAARAFLAAGLRREQFFRDYAFYLRPATDDRPYFFHFFRWRVLPLMLSTVGRSWVPFVEWGYLILVATLVQATLLGVLLIVLPLALLPRRVTPSEPAFTHPLPDRRARLPILLYFLALGLGYLFVEMALIQRLVFFLANPIYAVSVVLAGLLFVSGMGSAWGARQVEKGRSVGRLACLAAIGVAVAVTVYAFGLRTALTPLLSWPLTARMALSLAVMLPLAAMGIPFPLALRQLGQTHPELLPWAWAINGCASVVASPLATLLSLSTGLPSVLLAASACYVVAALEVRSWQTFPTEAACRPPRRSERDSGR